jgi:ubiquinone/menaquinone biosynthesis C-methylase UbiE
MNRLDYDAMAAQYARHRRPYPGLVEDLVAHAKLDRGSRVLEVGCGTANHLAAVKRATGAHCVGVDASEGMLDQAAGHDVELDLRVGRAEELPVPDGGFDLVFSVDVIHHVRQPAEYFAAASRVLRPGGLLCTATDSEWVIRNRYPMSHFFPGTVDVELARYHPVPLLRELAGQAGLVADGEQLFESWYPLTDLSKFADKAFSCLHLISEEEFTAGLATLRSAVAAGDVQANLRICGLWERRPEPGPQAGPEPDPGTPAP